MSETPVAWEDVASQLHPFIARRVPPADVDDVLQDVLLRMHRHLGALLDEQRFTGWMMQIARNAIAERGRDRARHPIAEASDVVEQPADGEDDRAEAAALASCLAVFVARLPSPYREAVTLVELEGMTAREAAALSGLSESGMKSRVQRGRAQLRAMLEACCDIAVDARGRVTDFAARRGGSCCPG